MAHPFDRHHILCVSQGGINTEKNIIRMDIRRHRALHMLFDNKTVPEQIGHILNIASTALTKEVKSDIIKILDVQDLEYWYEEGISKY